MEIKHGVFWISAVKLKKTGGAWPGGSAGWSALQDTRKAVGLVPGQGENGRQLINISLPLSQIN